MDISQYDYLWTNNKYDYVLVKTSTGYLIVNRFTNGVLLIEDENLAKQIEERMLQKGVPIFESGSHLMNNCTPINIVGQPTKREDFPVKRYKLFVEWTENIPLVVQVKGLKKAFTIVEELTNQELLEIARSNERWQFDTLYLDESKKTEIVKLAEKHRLKILMELDELREYE